MIYPLGHFPPKMHPMGITQLLNNEIAYRYANSSSSLYLSLDKSLQLPLPGLMLKLNDRQG